MLRFVTGVIFAAATALGQSADAPAPAAFEVASTKVSQSRSRGEGFGRDNIKTSPGSLTMLNVRLRTAIGWAYHVFDYQVTGPDWIGSERYDIVAKAAGPASEPEQRAMLQTLLADRFKLAVHRQTKEMSAMLLVVGKSGPKFQESKTEGDSSIQPQQKSMSIAAQRVPMSQLVDALARIFQVPVIDMTGLTSRYDVTINVAKYIPQNGEKIDPLSIIQTGLAEELGLKLESKKMPVDLVVVDRAEKTPIEN